MDQLDSLRQHLVNLLTKAEAQKMAGVAHDGLARAIRPAHTLFDGDTLFAISTGARAIGQPAAASFGVLALRPPNWPTHASALAAVRL